MTPTESMIPPCDETSISDAATCQEASSLSRGTYLPCGAPAVAVVRHDKDNRSYYMCADHANHNARNRGGRILLSKSPDKLQTQALTWKEKAVACKVVDQPTYDQAVEMLKGIKDLLNQAEAHHRPVIDAAHKTHKAALAALQSITIPLIQAEHTLKGSVGVYSLEQQRIALERQRLAEEAAMRQQEEERLQAAIAVEAAGAEPEEVQAVLEEPLPVVIPKVEPTYQKAAGIGARVTYSARVTNLRLLCKEVAEGRQPITLILPNEVALNAMARALNTALNIPGVELVTGSSVSVRR